MIWKHCKNFSEVETDDLYKALKLRQDVFIIEQDCIYEDIDGLDERSEHLFLFNNDELAGYLRIVPEGVKFDTVSIGRIVIDPKYRERGLGRKLVNKSIDLLSGNNVNEVSIEAQEHLERFYKSLGFKTISSPYKVDGIPHIKMFLEFEDI